MPKALALKRMFVVLVVLLATGSAPSVPLALPTSTVLFEFSETDSVGRGVAFHSLEFLDGNAHTIQTITFGTPEARAQQQDGWLEGESNAQIGTFQWAGGSLKRASLRLAIPEEAQAFLLHTMSRQDGVWMNVSVDGRKLTTVRVGTLWRKGYVPLGPPAPIAVPNMDPQWTEGRFFPRFPSTHKLYVIRVRSALEDWWSAPSDLGWRINQDFDTMMALTLVGMQGVINRHGPEVYLDWEDRGKYDNAARFWITPLRETVETIELDLDGLSAFSFLYSRYSAFFRGAVLFDPKIPDTINLATTLAGLEDRLILAPEQTTLPGIPQLSSTVDLVALAAQNGWDNTNRGRAAQYQWMYTNLWPRLEKRVIGLVSPGPPVGGPVSEGKSFPLALASRDYIVALKLPALYLSPSASPMKELFKTFLQGTDPPVPIYGFYANEEIPTVELASRHGSPVSVIANPNVPLSAANLSVFSGIPEPARRYLSNINRDRLVAALGDRPIMTLWSSDGDSLEVLYNRGFWGGTVYSWDTAKVRRFGWTINPTLAELAPTMWNHYIDTQAPANLVNALSGAGYAYPSLMDPLQLQKYLDYSARYLQDAGLRVLHFDNHFGPMQMMTHQAAAHYYQSLHPTGLLGIFTGNSGWPWGFGFYYPAVPMPIVYPSYVLDDSNAQGILDDLLARKPGEFFVDPAAPQMSQPDRRTYDWKHGRVVPDPGADRSQALLFSRQSVSGCCLEVWGPFSFLAPGDYTVAYRLKVTDNTSGTPFTRLFVQGQQEDVERTFSEQNIAPSNFVVAGQYQDFALRFTLDRFATNVEFKINYFGAPEKNPAADLSVDYVRAKRQGELNLPLIAGVFVIPAPGDLEQRLRIAEDFERRGGLVLTPDELMAALSPEYMMAWASPILGADHPALVEAQSLLNQGRYFESLSVVRKTLRNAFEPK